MSLSSLIKYFPDERKLTTSPRPYINHSVEFKKSYSSVERAKMLEKVGLNVFFFPAEMITGCDFLSDSGTTTMTNKQWANLHLGDESYGSNRGYFQLIKVIRETFGEEFFNSPELGKPNAFLFHQGRPCEDALFTALGRLGGGQIIPSNGHFDTTAANIEINKIKAVNLFSKELTDEKSTSYFKGNMDTAKLKKLLESDHQKIPLVYMTITNNTGGGQPASLSNIREVAGIVHSFHLPFFIDACRFAENAWFIKTYEKEYKNKSIPEIVRKIFSYCDGITISFKKDGLVNMGGGLFIKNDGFFMKKYPRLPEAILDYQIVKEGHPTYGGMSGRDIMALVEGLKTIVNEDYLTYRIIQVQRFGQAMLDNNIPVINPIGGHAVYLDINKFFKGTKMKPEDFGGISLTALLLSLYGHRACELGYFAFGSYDKKTGIETHPDVNFVRFAVPRLRYEDKDLLSAVEAVKALHDNRDLIPKVKVIYGRDLTLRHFKSWFAFEK
ncbi:MAG: tryptophanase [Candidatus Roizmanbacteria bacterium]|nr:tryptophanase [Candidatus Roizmanbacteria bacterium]